MLDIEEKYKSVMIIGSSSGIGKELCNIYYQKGFNIFATHNKKELTSSISSKCQKILNVDLSNQKGIYQLLDFAEESKPSNIIYLPGYIDGKDLYENSLQSMHSSFNINLFAYQLLIARTCGYMKSIGYGRYLSISSIGSKYGGSLNGFNYTISKKALEFFPKEYKNLAEYNIFFNNIICGITDTSILNDKKKEVLKTRIEKVPVKRMAKPIELALNCFRLCSYENTFQTLSNTTIAGGE